METSDSPGKSAHEGAANASYVAPLHDRLVERAERWLRGTKRCGVVLAERSFSGESEIPDVIGFQVAMGGVGHGSIVVECKTSRSDFFRDHKKGHRRPGFGMGVLRYYFTPAGLLVPMELPAQWGLAEVRGSIVKVVQEAVAFTDPFNDRLAREFRLLYSFARRAQLGVEPTVGCLLPKPKERHSIDECPKCGHWIPDISAGDVFFEGDQHECEAGCKLVVSVREIDGRSQAVMVPA